VVAATAAVEKALCLTVAAALVAVAQTMSVLDPDVAAAALT
jgi:hypothetical protein